jgi:hypothetical protein
MDFDAISAFAARSHGALHYLIRNFDEVDKTMKLLAQIDDLSIDAFANIIELVLSTRVNSASFERWIAALARCLN